MAFKVSRNDGKTVVLTQSHHAKKALYFSNEYSLVNAVNLAALSKLVYSDFDIGVKDILSNLSFKYRKNFSTDSSPEVKPFLVPYLGKKSHATEGITDIKAEKFISFIDTQAFHYNDDEYNVFVFRGTQELRDFAADGFAPKCFFLAGEVHQGFLDCFQAIKNQIVKIMNMPENNQCKTIITGHSLGGALATLTAAYISMNYASAPCGQVMLYTYGSPRVGVVKWVETFSDKFIHFRHRRVHDPITMLPPHHSSMKMPSLQVMLISGLEGGAVAGTALIIGETIFNSDDASDAFVHHGQGILLREGPKGVGVIKTNLTKEIVVTDGVGWNSKEALLAREFVKNITAFSQGITPHAMSGYFANLFHLLKEAIRAWERDPAPWLEMNKSISKQEAELIGIWKSERERDAVDFRVKPAVQSSTSTPQSRQPISQTEKSAYYDDIIKNAVHLKMQADTEIGIWSQPGAKDRMLRMIIPGELTPDIEKEMKYQETVSEESVIHLAQTKSWDMFKPMPNLVSQLGG